jgi:hypothetical protein
MAPFAGGCGVFNRRGAAAVVGVCHRLIEFLHNLPRGVKGKPPSFKRSQSTKVFCDAQAFIERYHALKGQSSRHRN